MNFVYANEDHSTIINEKNGVVFITFPKLVKAGICHGFSTRIGGVSEGHLSSMNLSFTRGDDPEKVQENFRRIGAAIGFDAKDLVLSSQIHESRLWISSWPLKSMFSCSPLPPCAPRWARNSVCRSARR